MQDPRNQDDVEDRVTHSDPVSVWMVGLRAADEVAARKIWEHFSSRLVAIARTSIRTSTMKRMLFKACSAASVAGWPTDVFPIYMIAKVCGD